MVEEHLMSTRSHGAAVWNAVLGEYIFAQAELNADTNSEKF